jgi:hypothetical protein
MAGFAVKRLVRGGASNQTIRVIAATENRELRVQRNQRVIAVVARAIATGQNTIRASTTIKRIAQTSPGNQRVITRITVKRLRITRTTLQPVIAFTTPGTLRRATYQDQRVIAAIAIKAIGTGASRQDIGA